MGLIEKKTAEAVDRKAGFDFVAKEWSEYGETFLKKRVYCVSAAIRTSKASGKAYVLFHLKDSCGKLFSAFMFNIGEDLERKAFKVSSLRGQFLEVSGEVGEFQGEPAYYLFEADVTEKLGSLGAYLGTEAEALDFLQEFGEKIRKYSEDVPDADTRWALASIPKVLDGKIGAFSRLALWMLEDLERFFEISNLKEDEKKEWLGVLREVLTQLFSWYQVPDPEVLLGAQAVLLAVEAANGKEMLNQVLLTDALLGVLGVIQPETVLGNLVKDSLAGFERRCKLANVNGTLLVGHGQEVRREVLKLPID